MREAYLELCREARNRRRPVPRHRADSPLVSVVVPYYRMDRFVEETIETPADRLKQAFEALHPDDMSPREALDALYALKKVLDKG